MVEKLKRVLSPFYTDRCTVYEKKAVMHEGRTRFEESVKYENVPCRVSTKAYLFGENAAKEKDRLLSVNKKVKIFLPCEYDIAPGSIIAIESRGRRRVYARSGEMSCYNAHNEVMVELLKNYA